MKRPSLQLALLVAVPLGIAGSLLRERARASRAERRCTQALALAERQVAQMSAFFDWHPDALACCDMTGHVVRVNRAQVALSGVPERASIGQHFTSFVAESSRPAALHAFGRAAAGERTALETQFGNAEGKVTDVRCDLFGDLGNGVTTGVTIASKSIVELKRVRALNAAHSQRIAALYAIACGHGRSSKEQMDDALRLAAGQLEYEWGGVSEIVEETVTILSTAGNTLGDKAVIAPGMQIPLKNSLAEFIVRSGDVWEVNDLPNSPWRNYPTVSSLGLGSVVAMPISVGASIYGTYCLAGRSVRTTALSDSDVNFIRLVAALLGSMIERKRQEHKLDSLAFFDNLTGLPNRVFIAEKLEQSISAADSRGATFFVLYLDLDRFKDINDRAGHAIGDHILRLAAQRMQQCIRTADTIGRFGGDEFVIIQAEANGHDGAVALADRLVAALAQPFVVNDVAYSLGLSVGISAHPRDGRDAGALLESADKAMYRAKRTARRTRSNVAGGTA